MIAEFKKPGRWSTTAALLIAALGLVTLTDGQTNRPENEPTVDAGQVTARFEPESLVKIGGTVLDHQGNAVVGAKVRALKGDPALPGQIVDVMTGEDGQWEMEVDLPWLGRFPISVLRGERVVKVFATGARPNINEGELLAGSARLTLPETFELKGMVRDSAGSPVAGATVLLSQEMPGAWSKTTSDEEGRFVIASFDEGRQMVLVAAGGFTPAYEWRNLGSERDDLTFELEAGHAYRGRISSLEGEPIEGARVSVARWNDVRVALASTTTDAKGRYTLDSLPANGLELSITAPGFLHPVLVYPDVANPSNDYTLEPAVEITGRVVDAETGTPLETFRVSSGWHLPAVDWTRWGMPRVVGGTEGVFHEYLTTTWIDSGIKVEADGYIPALLKSLSADDGDREIELALQRGEGPRGTVVASDGNPVAGAALAFTGDGVRLLFDSQNGFSAYGGASGHNAITDAQGRFEFPPKAEGGRILATHGRGYGEVRFDPEQSDYRIVLEPADSISNRLRIAGIHETGSGSVRRSGSTETVLHWVMSSMRTGDSADWEFTFDRVPPGNRSVEWQHQSRTFFPERVRHRIGPVEFGGELEIAPARPGRVIIGQFQLTGPAQSAHWKDLRLQATGDINSFPINEPADAFVQVFAIENGIFSSLPVEPGEYSLSVSAVDPQSVHETGGGENEVGRLTRTINVPRGEGPYHLGLVEVPVLDP